MIVVDLPTGLARVVYSDFRSRGRTVTQALTAAAKVAACPENYVCSQCHHLLDTSKEVRLRHAEPWCLECVMQTGESR